LDVATGQKAHKIAPKRSPGCDSRVLNRHSRASSFLGAFGIPARSASEGPGSSYGTFSVFSSASTNGYHSRSSEDCDMDVQLAWTTGFAPHIAISDSGKSAAGRLRSTIVIPARLASTRLPRKLLLAETGKPLIQHTYEAASRATRPASVVVAA